MNYTPIHHTAIKAHDYNLQIIVCAGSGKAQIISARIIEILQYKNGRCLHENYRLLHFREMAAGELKNRIHRLANAALVCASEALL